MVTAQIKYSKEQKKLKKEADFYFGYGDYVAAQNIYDSLYKIDSISPELNYKIGFCILIAADDLQKSSRYFIAASDAGYAAAYYYLANWYHFQYNFEKAIEYYNKYKLSAIKKNIPENRDVNKCIEISKRARDFMNNPIDVTIENIGPEINTHYPEYVPVISADESMLIFTSRRPGSTGRKLDLYRKYFEDVYISYKKDSVWKKPVGISPFINTDNHDACVGLSPDGTRLIIYRTNEAGTGGDLYWSDFEWDVWTAPIKYEPNINSNYQEPSASVTSEGNRIYFSSNRPGGFGGRDIYRSIRLPNGEWSLAQNLGSEINTPEDDDAPFIHPDNATLYFSSKGHATMGGYDVFKAALQDDESWSEAENIGYPINTTGDDIYFVLSPNGRSGYFSSGRTGGYGDQDIYIARMPYEFKDLTMITGTVTTKDSLNNPIRSQIIIRNFECWEK